MDFEQSVKIFNAIEELLLHCEFQEHSEAMQNFRKIQEVMQNPNDEIFSDAYQQDPEWTDKARQILWKLREI